MGTRVLTVSAYTYSIPLLAAVFDFQRRNPGRLHLVGLATDDPINADAHIDLRKCVWKYYSQDERVAIGDPDRRGGAGRRCPPLSSPPAFAR